MTGQLNKKMDNQRVSTKVSLWALAALLVFGLSGCAMQKGAVKGTDEAHLATEPIMDKRLSQEDFSFPASPPSLMRGKEVFGQTCAACHAPSYWQQSRVQKDLAYTTPIDLYLYLTKGGAPEVSLPTGERRQLLPKSHPAFRDSLSRDDRWAALFYVRHLAGGDDVTFASRDGKPLTMDAIFGGNCAVCHGSRGFADGFLATGHASSHELGKGKLHGGLFMPPPANFHDYARMYNRSDVQIAKYIKEGIYPSAMPPWGGQVDRVKNFEFTDDLIFRLVRHVRRFSYKYDLPDDAVVPKNSLPIAELMQGTETAAGQANHRLTPAEVDALQSKPSEHAGHDAAKGAH